MFESVRGGYGGTTAAAARLRSCRGWGRWALLSLRKRVHLPWNPKVNQHVHGLISFTHPLNKIVRGLRPGKSHSNDSYRINGEINDLFSSFSFKAMRIGSVTFWDPFMQLTLKNNIFDNFDEAAKLSKAPDEAYNHGEWLTLEDLLNEGIAQGFNFEPHDFIQYSWAFWGAILTSYTSNKATAAPPDTFQSRRKLWSRYPFSQDWKKVHQCRTPDFFMWFGMPLKLAALCSGVGDCDVRFTRESVLFSFLAFKCWILPFHGKIELKWLNYDNNGSHVQRRYKKISLL